VQAFAENLFAAGGPIDFDAIDFCSIAETEIERQNTLRQIAGFAVVVPCVGLAVRL